MHKGNFLLGNRLVGFGAPPLVIAEIGINHEGDFDKAVCMIRDAASVGCECVKFQTHIIDDEMIPNDVVPGNASETIWEIMNRCALDEDQERELKKLTEDLGMIFLSTPFSRAAAIRLENMGVCAYKIGSGECNNYPLVEHIAAYGKPVIVSTGMNNISSINRAVSILRMKKVPYALLHCTSIYPTPYEKVRLGAIKQLTDTFPDAVVGLSDHSLSIYPCFGAIALGAQIIERHFTSDKCWPGPDISISMDPLELSQLLIGTNVIYQALGGYKSILPEEQPTIDFAYACVVAIRDIEPGVTITENDIWVKRPGTGEIKAKNFNDILGRRATRKICKNEQLTWDSCSS